MTFSEALEALKNGKKLSRSGWNGKDQYIELGKDVSYISCDGSAVKTNYDCIVFHGTSGIQVGWLASQGDLLANDWVIK